MRDIMLPLHPNSSKTVNIEPKTQSEELDLLKSFPFTYIRKQIRDKVTDTLWLDDLQRIYDDVEKMKNNPHHEWERCAICTLPYGTCKHTTEWIHEKEESKVVEAIKTEVERDIDDIMDILSPTNKIENIGSPKKTNCVEIDPYGLKWYQLEQRLSDKIGSDDFCLSAPPPRGWHSTVVLGSRYTVVYGGLRFRKSEVPQPFSSAPRGSDIECQRGVFIYDINNLSWHSKKADGGLEPPPRYGHCACGLDDISMLIFGGKDRQGRFLQDSWIYDIVANRWYPIKPTIPWATSSQSNNAANDYSSGMNYLQTPSARVFSDCVWDGEGAVLFGGTNGLENFGDLWRLVVPKHNWRAKIVTVSNSECFVDLKWEKIMAVGPPPSPRYGHRIVALSSGELMVMGGCAVSPESELGQSSASLGSLSALGARDRQHLMEVSGQLQRAYNEEGRKAELAGRILEDLLEQGVEMKVALQEAAVMAGRLYETEKQTRESEIDLLKTLQQSQASKLWQIKQAKHPMAHVDIHFLSSLDWTWKPRYYPKLHGLFPSSRMFFGAISLGCYVFLVGGCHPTSNRYDPVDSKVYVLDLAQMKWFCPNPISSTTYLDVPFRVAQADILRAQSQCREARSRSISLGKHKDDSPEVLEADRILEVCQWRLSQLERERDSLIKPPATRWGATFVSTGHQRGFLLGGWTKEGVVADDAPLNSLSVSSSATASSSSALASSSAVPGGREVSYFAMTLDVEEELEKRRRENDEFQAKIERERIAKENTESLHDQQHAYEVRAQVEMERSMERRERLAMSIEDMISAVPPLSKPSPVRVTGANAHSIWVEWDKITKDSNNIPLEPDHQVTYLLFMRNSFQLLSVEDRVIATLPRSTTGDKSMTKPSSSKTLKNVASNLFPSQDGRSISTVHPDSPTLEYAGEIVKVWKDGFFDVSFDDGTFRSRLPRFCLRLESPGYLYDNQFSAKMSSYHKLYCWTSQSKRALSTAGSSRPSTTLSTELNAKNSSNPSHSHSHSHSNNDMANSNNLSSGTFVSRSLEIRLAKKERIKEKRRKLLLKFNPNIRFRTLQSSQDLLSSVLELNQSSMNDSKTFHSSMYANENGDNFGVTITEGQSITTNLTNCSSPSSTPSTTRPPTAPASRVTVVPDSSWQLVYQGEDMQCNLTGLIPRYILEREPTCVAHLELKLQVFGIDVPTYEGSQLSESCYCHTLPYPGWTPSEEELLARDISYDHYENNENEDSEDDDNDGKESVDSKRKRKKQGKKIIKGGSTKTNQGKNASKNTISRTRKSTGKVDEDSDLSSEDNDDDNENDENEEEGENNGEPKLVSKVRKLVLSAVVEDSHVIQISCLGSTYSSLGVGNEYL